MATQNINWGTLALGVFCFAYGLSTIYFRLKAPSKFGKLAAMQKAWGHRIGSSIHIVNYTVIPLVFGTMLILGGLKGVSFFGK